MYTCASISHTYIITLQHLVRPHNMILSYSISALVAEEGLRPRSVPRAILQGAGVPPLPGMTLT